MKRGKIVIKVLDDIVNRIDAATLYGQAWVDHYNDEKLVGVSNAITQCETITIEPYHHIILQIKSVVDHPGEFIENANVHSIPCFTLSVKEKARLKRFKTFYSMTDPYVATLDIFGDKDNITLTSENWMVWERIWASIFNKPKEKNKFWNELLSPVRSEVYINTSMSKVTSAKKWKMYSYAYLSCINEREFAIPTELQESRPFVLYPALTYINGAKYDQFFDVYDVLNEVKHAPDLLTRFMKIYQVLELLAYRRKFQQLIKNHEKNHYPIVREIISITEGFKKSEMQELTDLFLDKFPNIANKLDPPAGGTYPAASSYLNTDCTNTVSQLYKISVNGHPAYTTKTIASIVYKIRCSIVHNKETEFHFTYNNVDEYSKIVPLMRKLCEILLEEIMGLINDGTKLVYGMKTLTLY